MIAIIDYGVGNLFSLLSSFQAIGIDAIVTNASHEIAQCSHVILPGVGAFGDAAQKLQQSGMADMVKKEVKRGKPVMGICLGMQLLFEKSYEYGQHQGLGLLKGSVISMKGNLPEGYKIPHMGWNQLHFVGEKNKLFRYIKEGDVAYFVHSYYATDCADSLIATTDYGLDLTAAVAKDNLFGCQFHPEKSGAVGLKILQAFCEMEV